MFTSVQPPKSSDVFSLSKLQRPDPDLRKFISQLTNVILVFAAFERVILATTKHERSLFLQNNAPVSSECGLYPDGSGFMSMINIIYRLH